MEPAQTFAISVSLLAIASGLYQYFDRSKGKIRVFVSVPYDSQYIPSEANPKNFIQIKFVNIASEKRLISNITFSYDRINTNLGLHKLISYPIELESMKPYELIIPVQKFLSLKTHMVKTTPEIDTEDFLSIYVSDSTGKIYRSTAVVIIDHDRIFDITTNKGTTVRKLNHYISVLYERAENSTRISFKMLRLLFRRLH